MVSPTVGIGTLSRLNAIDTAGQPVLSVYLDLDRARCPGACAREGQLETLISRIDARTPVADLDRVRQMLRCSELACGARGLALFSSAEGTVFEAIQLPCMVEPIAVVDTAFWLEPIIDMSAAGRSSRDNDRPRRARASAASRCLTLSPPSG